MAGRHLRRSGPDPRVLLSVVLTLLLGALIGATAVWISEDDVDGAVVTSDASDEPSTPVATGTAAATPDPGPITLAFAGDIYTEYALSDRLAEQPDDFIGPFADVLADAELAVVNLEAALTDTGSPLDKEYTFQAPPEVLDALAAGGVDVVSAANNHAMDNGREGLEGTLAIKRARADGMVIGIGANEDEAYAPFVREIGGHTVAVIAATQVMDADLIASWTAGPDQGGVASAKRVDRLVQEVRSARRIADTVVVFLHWGVERDECPSAGQQELAGALEDAGADVIVGAHAHRVQGGGRLGKAVVNYGLGSFMFGEVSPESARTGVFLVEIDDRDVIGYRWVPGRIEGSVPQPLQGADADAEVAAWEEQRSCTDLTP